MATDYLRRKHNQQTLLAARLSVAVLEVLDSAAPSYFVMFDAEGVRLQTALEGEIGRQVVRWMRETAEG